MRFTTSTCVLIALCGLLLVGDSHAWDKHEHRLLADSVYHSVMRQCDQPSGDTAYMIGQGEDRLILPHRSWDEQTFGELCADLAADDMAPDRFHERGRTVLEQLEPLTYQRIKESWNTLGDWAHKTSLDTNSPVVLPSLAPAKNTIEAYLLYHLMALQLAASHTDSVELKRDSQQKALVMEAVAQGYLADAFSAGHLLVDRADPLRFLHRRNIIEAHNYHRNQGVYVINSRGDAWQTMGDKLMHWHAPTYRKVFEACRTSLLEVLCAGYHDGRYDMPSTVRSWLDSVAADATTGDVVSSWLSEHDGMEYYNSLKMPTLMLLPMPVAATWSFRTDDEDDYGIRRHWHFPQLSDDGFHDSSLSENEIKELHSRSSMPWWMTPMPLQTKPPPDPDSLVKRHPDWASVRWTQIRYAPPSYKGLLIHLGGQLTFDSWRGRVGGMVGVGYGVYKDLILLNNFSVDVRSLWAAGTSDRLLLTPSVGAGLPFLEGRLKAIRFDGGVSIDLRKKYGDVGPMFAFGCESRVYRLGLPNAGFTWRLQYQVICLNHVLHGPTLQLVLQ